MIGSSRPELPHRPPWQAPSKPRLRGVVHQYAFFASLPLGLVLVVAASDARATLATAIYATAVSALLGMSALYHRVTWSTASRRWMRRLDHAMIFVIIAGSYTPWALAVLDGTLADAILVLVWAGALVGFVLQLAWHDAPKWFLALTYVAVGSVTAAAVPAFVDQLGLAGTGLLLLAGVLSLVGAAVYALRRPDPAPTNFGYHEVFHLLIVVALAAHSLAVALYVVPGTGVT